MSDVTEIKEEGATQLEIIETGGGTIEIVGEGKTIIEIVENTSSTNDLDISTITNTVVVDSNPSQGTSIDVSEDTPTKIEIESPPVSVDIIDKVLISNATQLSFNNLVDKPFEFDTATERVIVNNFSSSTVITNIINSSTGSFSHIEGNSPITFKDESRFQSSITASSNISASGVIIGSNLSGNNTGDQNLSSFAITGSNVIFNDITASNNLRSVGLLFASASDASGSFNQVVLYDTASGRFYYTGSYGGGGSGTGDATLSFVTSTVSNSLEFNGNRFITRQGIFDSSTPNLNLGTSGSIQNFLEAYFFPNTPPTIINGNGSINEINEFTPSGTLIHILDISDPEVDSQLNLGSGRQTLSFSTSSTYTDDKFRIISSDDGLKGEIYLNSIATESFNTEINNFYSEKLAHKFPIIVQDSNGAFTEDDLFIRIKPNNIPIFKENSPTGTTIESKTIILYEISSFSSSIQDSGESSLIVAYAVDPDGGPVTITTGSKSSNFDNDFKIIINDNNVELSQSKAVLDFSTNATYTFELTASDGAFESGLDLNATSSLSVGILIQNNQEPFVITKELPSINENSNGGDLVANLVSENVFVDFDNNETGNIVATNIKFLGAFHQNNQDINITGSYGGTSLLDPTENPFEFISNDVKRKSDVFLNSDIINLYKYQITAKSLITGATGSSGIISIPIADHTSDSPLILGGGNGNEGYIIESSIIGNFVSADSNGILGNVRTIQPQNFSTNNIFHNWIVTSSHGDFFESTTIGDSDTGNTLDGTGSQIQIRLKNNISGSAFSSGSIVTCSITASQDNFPTTKQFFEFPVNITKNKGPVLSKINETDNWVNTIAIKDTTLSTISAYDPEQEGLDYSSFQFVGNSSTDLSSSTDGNGNFFIQAGTILRNSSDYPEFTFTASLADIHGFRTSSISDIITLESPTINPTITTNNLSPNSFVFNIIESSLPGENVVINENGQSTGTQARINVDFSLSEGGINTEIREMSLNDSTFEINNSGYITRGNGSISQGTLTKTVKITDNFSNIYTQNIEINVTENFAPTFDNLNFDNLTSSLDVGTPIAKVFNVNDEEGDEAIITAFTYPDNTPLTIEEIGNEFIIKLTEAIPQSSTPSDYIISVTASHSNPTSRPNFNKSTDTLISVNIAANIPQILTINPSSQLIAPQPIGTIIASVSASSNDGDTINVSLEHLELELIGPTETGIYNVRTIENIPGNENSDTTFNYTILSTDGLHTVNKETSFIIKGNQAPTFNLTPIEDLIFPIPSGQTLATISNVNDDLNQTPTFTVTSSNIPGGLTINDGGTTKYIQTNQRINSGSLRSYNIGVTGSDDYSNLREKSTTAIIEANLPPSIGTIEISPGMVAPIDKKFAIANFTYNDPANEEVTLSIGDDNFIITDNRDGTAALFYNNNNLGLPGNTNTDTTLIGAITASDDFTTVTKDFEITITGNLPPTFTFTPSEGLFQTLGANTILGVIDYTEPEGETVTFLETSDNIFLEDKIANESKYVKLQSATTSPDSQTITFEVKATDEQTNSTVQTFSVNITNNSAPTFTISSFGPFRAGNYPQSHSVIALSIPTDPQGLDVTYNLGTEDNNNKFFIDNVSEEGFRVKTKEEILGTTLTDTTFVGSITASNGVTQKSVSFQVLIHQNQAPLFEINENTGLTVPLTSGTIIATINNVDDTQDLSFKSINQTFKDTPYSSSISAISPLKGNVVIESKSIDDTLNYDIIYTGETPLITAGNLPFDVEIYDKFGNTGSKSGITILGSNGKPTFNVNVPHPTISSPISHSVAAGGGQIVATVTNITDNESEDPYTCSLFYQNGLPFNEGFVASPIIEGDTTSFNISASSAGGALTNINIPLDFTYNLRIKIEDNFGSFNTQDFSFNVNGDNVAPVITPNQVFEVKEHAPVGTKLEGLVEANDFSEDSFTFGSSSNYIAGNFNINENGSIVTLTSPLISLNTIDNNNDGILKHPLIITASDNYNFTTEETIYVRIIPNNAPIFGGDETFYVGAFDEYTTKNTSLGLVNAFDEDGDSITFRTQSGNTDGFVNVNEITGEIQFATSSGISMHNTSNNATSSIVIEAIDEFNHIGSQSVEFSIIANRPPVIRETSIIGPIIPQSYTMSISEDEINSTQSLYYTTQSGDILTLLWITGSDVNTFFNIADVSQSQKIEFHQKGDLEFDTNPFFDLTLSASDQHFPTEDPESVTVRNIRIELSTGTNPELHNQTLSGVNESSADGTSAGNIISDNTSYGLIITNFRFIGAYKETISGLGDNISGSYNGSGPFNPHTDPFESINGSITITKKTGMFLNSDLINLYQYSASVQNPAGNTNSAIISIPIQNHNPGSFYTFPANNYNIIESAVNGDMVVSNANGINSQYTIPVSFTPPSGFEDGYNFEISSSENFFNPHTDINGNLRFLLNKNLSGSNFTFNNPGNINTNFTASLISFPSSKISGSLAIRIRPNSAPPLTSSSIDAGFTDNWNSVDATPENTLVEVTIGNDVEGDDPDTDSITITPSTYLTHSFNANTINISPKSTLTTGTYPYTLSINDEHGFRASAVSGSIVIIEGDTGSLDNPGNLFILNTATSPDFVVLNSHGVGQSGGALGRTQAQLSVTFESEDRSVTEYISSSSLFTINPLGLISVNSDITSSYEVENNQSTIETPVYWISDLGSYGTGSITASIVPNTGPNITFTPTSPSLQHPIETTDVLGQIAAADPQGFYVFTPTLSDNTNLTIGPSGILGTFNVKPKSPLTNGTTETTINFDITVKDADNIPSTLPNQSIKITAKDPLAGTLKLSGSEDSITDNNIFYILETATSGDSVITGSILGISNPNKAAILSASFDTNSELTTENSPTPIFTIDNDNFIIVNSNGLGKIQASPTFNYNNSIGEKSAIVSYTTQNGTVGPDTTIKINVTKNFGPTFTNIINTPIDLDTYSTNNIIFIINSVNDTEGDFPISVSITNQIYNGVEGTYLNTPSNLSTAGSITITGKSNINNSGAGGILTCDITLTDSEGKTNTTVNSISIDPSTPLATPELTLNGDPYLIESDGSNTKIKIDHPGTTDLQIGVNYTGVTATVNQTLLSINSNHVSSNYLQTVNSNKIKIKSGQTLSGNSITPTNSPFPVEVRIITTPNLSSYPNLGGVSSTHTFDLDILQNFPPTASLSQTEDTSLEGPMTASNLGLSDTIFTVSGIHDPEEDQGYIIEINNQSSNLSIGSNLLDTTAGIIGATPGNSGSIAIKPKPIVISQTTGQTITFDVVLTDAAGSSRTYPNQTITIADPTPVVVVDTTVYIYRNSSNVYSTNGTGIIANDVYGFGAYTDPSLGYSSGMTITADSCFNNSIIKNIINDPTLLGNNTISGVNASSQAASFTKVAQSSQITNLNDTNVGNIISFGTTTPITNGIASLANNGDGSIGTFNSPSSRWYIIFPVVDNILNKPTNIVGDSATTSPSLFIAGAVASGPVQAVLYFINASNGTTYGIISTQGIIGDNSNGIRIYLTT